MADVAITVEDWFIGRNIKKKLNLINIFNGLFRHCNMDIYGLIVYIHTHTMLLILAFYVFLVKLCDIRKLRFNSFNIFI